MSLALPFPDIEDGLIGWLQTRLTPPAGGTLLVAGTYTPEMEKAHKAVVRVELLDDPDDGITRAAFVQIEVFASTRSVAYPLAQEIRGALLSTRKVGEIVVDRVDTVSGPKRVPWDNANIRRFLATYRISTRR